MRNPFSKMRCYTIGSLIGAKSEGSNIKLSTSAYPNGEVVRHSDATATPNSRPELFQIRTIKPKA